MALIPPEVRETFEEDAQRNAGLQSCELCAEAEVNAVSEGEMWIRAAMDVEGVRRFEDGRIMVRRSDPDVDLLTRLERLTAQLRCLLHAAAHLLYR